jgi:ribosomal protein S18 acetylase RimI-like enzyme
VRRHLLTAAQIEVSLRPVLPADEPFLHALYVDRRAPELATLGWEREEQRAFLDMQFRAQQAGYATSFPGADHWVVSVDDHAVGRLLVDRRPDEHRVVDMVILSEYRGSGIGTALMAEVMERAGTGTPVRLSAVAHDHRLVRWYEGLGFTVVGHRGPNVLMEWRREPNGGG